jgi:phage shock protein A
VASIDSIRGLVERFAGPLSDTARKALEEELAKFAAEEGPKLVDDFGRAEESVYDVVKRVEAKIDGLHERVQKIEDEAKAAMDPDKMMDLATRFLGGGLPGFKES